MDWIRTARAFAPAIFAILAMVIGVGLVTNIGKVEILAGIVPIARWILIAPLLYALFHIGWVMHRFRQAERGVGPLCRTCHGPLGRERLGRYGAYRKCLACWNNTSNRYYR